MTLSTFTAACESLARHILGPAARARVTLTNSPELSATNPALIFRVGLASDALWASQIMQALAVSVGITGDDITSPVLIHAVERALARGMNTHAPFVDLHLGMAHIITGSPGIAADADWMIFDFRCSPTSYDHDA